jgi:hypothetical protein
VTSIGTATAKDPTKNDRDECDHRDRRYMTIITIAITTMTMDTSALTIANTARNQDGHDNIHCGASHRAPTAAGVGIDEGRGKLRGIKDVMYAAIPIPP